MPFFINNHTVTPGSGVTLIPIDMVVGGTLLPFKSVFPKAGVWCCRWAQWVLCGQRSAFRPPRFPLSLISVKLLWASTKRLVLYYGVSLPVSHLLYSCTLTLPRLTEYMFYNQLASKYYSFWLGTKYPTSAPKNQKVAWAWALRIKAIVYFTPDLICWCVYMQCWWHIKNKEWKVRFPETFPVSVKWVLGMSACVCLGWSWRLYFGAAPLLWVTMFFLLSELWLVVPGSDHLCDAVRIPSFLLQTPQSDYPKGHAEKDHDRQFWVPRGRVEPDLRDGQRCCEEVSPWVTGWGGRGGLKVVEHKGMLSRKKSFVCFPGMFLPG